jgi:hypothetical protein
MVKFVLLLFSYIYLLQGSHCCWFVLLLIRSLFLSPSHSHSLSLFFSLHLSEVDAVANVDDDDDEDGDDAFIVCTNKQTNKQTHRNKQTNKHKRKWFTAANVYGLLTS